MTGPEHYIAAEELLEDVGACPRPGRRRSRVDGSKAFVTLEISVRWPASVPEITGQVRRHVRDRFGS